MKREHCDMDDRHAPVYASNYGNCTFAELEWHFIDDEEKYEELVREFGVVVEGELVDEVKGGGWTKGSGGPKKKVDEAKGGEDVQFFLERELRSDKTQEDFEKLPDWKRAELRSVEQWNKEERERCRKFKKLSDFQSKVRMFNHKLRGLGLEGAAAEISEAELITARLYTGPMFVKYNGILRGMGDVRDATRHPELGWALGLGLGLA